jgi:hypothetical protein
MNKHAEMYVKFDTNRFLNADYMQAAFLDERNSNSRSLTIASCSKICVASVLSELMQPKNHFANRFQSLSILSFPSHIQ